MKKFSLLASLLFVSTITFCQIGSADSTGMDSGNVVVHKDPRLALLVKKQAQINEETTREARRSMKGFRILVINTNNRDEAISAKTKVYTYFPELKSYLLYQSPYFKLKAGNFKTREEAEDYRRKLNPYFSQGVFVIPDIVEVNPEQNQLDGM